MQYTVGRSGEGRVTLCLCVVSITKYTQHSMGGGGGGGQWWPYVTLDYGSSRLDSRSGWPTALCSWQDTLLPYCLSPPRCTSKLMPGVTLGWTSSTSRGKYSQLLNATETQDKLWPDGSLGSNTNLNNLT